MKRFTRTSEAPYISLLEWPEYRESISLAGEWSFALDRENEGIREGWFSRELEDHISLPGTTDEAKKGDFVDEQCDNRLSRLWRWIGPAWYQRRITIPDHWHDKRISLFLERTKDSQIWIDDVWMGSDASLSTPHALDLDIATGEHTLTILVDNAKLPPVGPCHQVDERTQTNWNGIVGRIELQASERIWLADIQTYPDTDKPSVHVTFSVENTTKWTGHVDVTIEGSLVGRENELEFETKQLVVRSEGRTTFCEYEYPLPDNTPLWDEFGTSLISLVVEIEAQPRARKLHDCRKVVFGLREFTAGQGRFSINNRSIFLRGKNDAALFPLTGYAPMDKDAWLRHLGIAADYGINHYRFHSWCPPEAAFQAADELGIYFQVELPNKREITAPDNHEYVPSEQAYETLDELRGSRGHPGELTAYLYREGERILAQYGNHPSFVMLTLGNELGGDEDVMRSLCDHFRKLDSRHLYAMGTNHFHWDVGYRDGDEFWVTGETAVDQPVRGASFEARHPCHVDNHPPSTTVDYSRALQGVPVPVVGHEMAQYEVYPDFSEIRQYTGVTRARNLEIFRERLDDAGMLDQARDFLKASGALSAICHREDVEAALRTSGFGGFQMLDLQDFSGQGTALVGMLNVFMKSKGLISPKEWRRFCCETVPLLWMIKYTWTNNETFRGRIRIAHYGPADLENQAVLWQVTAGTAVIAKGESRRITVKTGDVTDIDLIGAPLNGVTDAQKLRISLTIRGTRYRNDYHIWVYPADVDTTLPEGIVLSRSVNRRTKADLIAGKRILLIPKPETTRQSVRGAFQTSFWCWPMFRKTALDAGLEVAAGTLGILCDPVHPLFAEFPTESHSNWQWWRMVKNGRPLILDSTPTSYRPIVQVIDNFARNHKLGLIWEAKIGKGKLLICNIDLPALFDHPEARQLFRSMCRYMESNKFDPAHELDIKLIESIV